ncbi:MAG TPA: radical SAM protein, partial [Candidatus Omnitrophota bacterium]|nr:radical SAM protein [Candidatus Omnitrophota bacterium]
ITMTARGCPNACSYCCFSYLQDLYKGKGERIRQRSVANVMNELRINKAKYNIKFVAFMDNCFGYDIKWLREFAPAYQAEVGIKFWCIMHPKDVTEEALKYLKLAGCHTIDMGVQSWNERIRKEILRRDVDNETMSRAIQMVKNHRIEIMTDSIFDLPGQTEDDILESARRYAEIRPKRIYFYMLRHYPNTLITRWAKRDNRLTASRYEEVMDGVNVTSFTIGGDQVNKRMIQFQILFYLIDLIPKRVSLFIIRKKLYRYFPLTLGPAMIVILRNLLAFDMNARLQRAWAFNRYAHFIGEKIRPGRQPRGHQP